MPLPGQSRDTPIPAHLNRWNWGAFLLNWIWGIGNSTYIALLMFVPFVNIVMLFVLGAKGSGWAWKNRLWTDEEHFRRTQRNWARAGVIVLIAVVVLVPGLLFGVIGLMTDNDAYRQSMAMLRSDQRAIATLGEPIEAGWFVTGRIETSNAGGAAELAIPVSGPKASGTLFVAGAKSAGVWTIERLVLAIDGVADPIILVGGNTNDRLTSVPRTQVMTGANRTTSMSAAWPTA